jgi:hypothetical protein
MRVSDRADQLLFEEKRRQRSRNATNSIAAELAESFHTSKTAIADTSSISVAEFDDKQ